MKVKIPLLELDTTSNNLVKLIIISCIQKWNLSQNYYKILNKKNHLWHKSIGYRKVMFGTIANEIISLGDEFYIFDKDFKKLQMRKTVKEREYFSENSKRQGKEILFNAPGQFKVLLQQKLGYLDKELHIIKD